MQKLVECVPNISEGRDQGRHVENSLADRRAGVVEPIVRVAAIERCHVFEMNGVDVLAQLAGGLDRVVAVTIGVAGVESHAEAGRVHGFKHVEHFITGEVEVVPELFVGRQLAGEEVQHHAADGLVGVREPEQQCVC